MREADPRSPAGGFNPFCQGTVINQFVSQDGKTPYFPDCFRFYEDTPTGSRGDKRKCGIGEAEGIKHLKKVNKGRHEQPFPKPGHSQGHHQ